MPTIDPRARYPKGNVRLAIPSLSGGVGRQAPTKRAVNEAENIDNALVTLERSIEKRSPMAFIRRYQSPAFDVLDPDPLASLDLGSTDATADFFFYWFSISDTQRYLVSIDYASADPSSYLNVYRTTADGFYKCNVDGSAMHEYFTYGYEPGVKNPLKAITIGPQLIILNTLVYTGYTSVEKTFDGTEDIVLVDASVITPAADDKYWCRVGLDGDFKRDSNDAFIEDIDGRKLVYFTSTPVDPEGEASIYVSSKFYITNDQVFANVPAGTDLSNWGYTQAEFPELDDYVASGVLESDTVLIFNCTREGAAENEPVAGAPAYDGGSVTDDDAIFALRSDSEGGALAKYIPVEDWDYPEASKAYLGSALEDFSEFNFPPNASDVDDSNEGVAGLRQPPTPDPGGHATLAALYPDELVAPANGRTTDGHGKIYYVENSYAGEPPGYYIIRNADDKPYVKLVRSPAEFSVIDKTRFPKILKVTEFDEVTGVETFQLEDFALEPRTYGTLQTNPGPAAYKEGVQVPLKSMAFFRDRLFLSAGDNVFSSRTGDFSDFWVEDAATVNQTDPIDVRLSTNKYAPVASMTPFQQYLFINTESDVQFTLQGSENRITPLNTEVSPTAFYSTAPLIDPILLGSQIYFFAPRRTYIYFNDATVSVNQAIETSLTCPDYLPTSYKDVAVVPGYDTILMTDEDNAKFLYLYTNRYSGGKVSQNAFFRYIYRVDLEFMASFDNDMYFVTRTPDGTGYRYNIGFQKFREEDHSVPLLDQWVYVGGADDPGSVIYNSTTNTTTFTIPKYYNLNPESIYVVPQESDPASGEVYDIDPDNITAVNGTVIVTYEGDLTATGRRYVIGTGYTMDVELSPQYYRDDNQNVVEGVLSLRTMSTQHFNTGNYRVEKDINGRRSVTMTFSPQELDALGYTDGFNVPLPLYETKGETFSKIMGFSVDTKLHIISDYPNPCNITQIELKGRFTGKSSGFVR